VNPPSVTSPPTSIIDLIFFILNSQLSIFLSTFNALHLHLLSVHLFATKRCYYPRVCHCVHLCFSTRGTLVPIDAARGDTLVESPSRCSNCINGLEQLGLGRELDPYPLSFVGFKGLLTAADRTQSDQVPCHSLAIPTKSPTALFSQATPEAALPAFASSRIPYTIPHSYQKNAVSVILRGVEKPGKPQRSRWRNRVGRTSNLNLVGRGRERNQRI
jgi:hypothetical protein